MLPFFGFRKTGQQGWSDRLPEIDADRCLLAGSILATCDRCQNACPHGAIVQDDDCLGIDTEACTGCGLCQPACPPAAITVLPVLPESGQEALAICPKAEHAGDVTLPCLHAIDLPMLADMHGRGIRSLEIRTGDCSACELGHASGFDDRLALFNRMMESRGLDPLGAMRRTGRSADSRRFESPDSPDAARRRLLLGLAGRSEEGDSSRRQALVALLEQGKDSTSGAVVCQAVPTISPSACSGCDLCARICPEGAIRLMTDQQGMAWYDIRPGACSGCGLCADLCESDAIAIEPAGTGKDVKVALDSRMCAACGAGFHQTCVDLPDSRLCPTCQKTNHQSKLFQVLP